MMEETLKSIRNLYPQLNVEQLERLLVAYMQEIDAIKKELEKKRY